MVQLNPVPVFGAKKRSITIWRTFFTEISVQMVSAQDLHCSSSPEHCFTTTTIQNTMKDQQTCNIFRSPAILSTWCRWYWAVSMKMNEKIILLGIVSFFNGKLQPSEFFIWSWILVNKRILRLGGCFLELHYDCLGKQILSRAALHWTAHTIGCENNINDDLTMPLSLKT